MCMIRDVDCMASVYNETFPTARKEHKCTECRRIIQPKEKYKNIWGVWEGDSRTYKICSHCSVATDLLVRECDGFLLGDVLEDLREHRRHYDWSRDARRLAAGMYKKWTFNNKMLPVPKLVCKASNA